MKGTLVAALVAIVTACGAAPAAQIGAPTMTATPPPSLAVESSLPAPAPSATPRPLPHVFVVVMENTSFARAVRSRTIGSLASRYSLATNYHAVARPSLPNYLALTSGTTWDIADNGYHELPAADLGTQLTGAGISWRAYMEGMSAGCMRSPYPYALKHNPFAYYGGGCPENVVPLEALDDDLAGATPNFVWITPGLCHDGHDCAIDVAGAWLDELVARIVASRAWQEDGVLFVTWDEGDGGDANLVPLIVARPSAARRESDAAYDHYSLLATIEDLFGLPRLGAARDAAPIVDLLAGQ